jgi:hypothetical protein
VAIAYLLKGKNTMRDSPPDHPEDDERDLGGPGWEREHAIDYSDYLDALLDPDDPLHAVAVEANEKSKEVDEE